MSHTYSTLAISQQAYDEIRRKLAEAEYDHAFMPGGEIDMHGIAVELEPLKAAPQAVPAPAQIDFTRATELTPEVEAAIDDAFEYHPWSDSQVAAGRVVRLALADAVKVIVKHVPPGPDRSAAIRKIREARMDANSAITHHGRY